MFVRDWVEHDRLLVGGEDWKGTVIEVFHLDIYWISFLSFGRRELALLHDYWLVDWELGQMFLITNKIQPVLTKHRWGFAFLLRKRVREPLTRIRLHRFTSHGWGPFAFAVPRQRPETTAKTRGIVSHWRQLLRITRWGPSSPKL